jgi:hypothetical protein
MDRRFGNGFQMTASYTWSRNIDSGSDGIGDIAGQSAATLSIAAREGGLRLDRGRSDFDRTHRLAVLYVWSLPGPARRFWRYLLGGWSIGGITSFQSGAPYTVANNFDRNNDGLANDRPDIGNPMAPLNTRAIIATNCAAGYRNPDTDLCVTPADVHWIQGTGMPNGATVGRNTLWTGGINNFDVSLSKSFRIAEQKQLQFRLEALNALNHPQFTQVPEKNVGTSPPGHFLNRDFTDSGIRSMWVQLKILF